MWEIRETNLCADELVRNALKTLIKFSKLVSLWLYRVETDGTYNIQSDKRRYQEHIVKLLLKTFSSQGIYLIFPLFTKYEVNDVTMT